MASISIDDIRLPDDVERGAQGGPAFNTTVNTTEGGYEQTNQNWSNPRSEWDIGYGIRNRADLNAVLNFFMARRGRARGFRFKDWLDFAVDDQMQNSLGPGDGTTTGFQLVKVYRDDVNALSRKITRPIASSVSVFVDGALQAVTTDYGLDDATGVVTFTSPPGIGAVVSAQFEFDLPVRFDTDQFPAEVLWADAIEVAGLTIVEVRE